MATGKRELIDTGTDQRYVRRDEKGRFDEVVDVGRSLSQDRKRHAEKTRASRVTAIEATVNAEHVLRGGRAASPTYQRTTGREVRLSPPRLTDKAGPASGERAAHRDLGHQ